MIMDSMAGAGMPSAEVEGVKEISGEEMEQLIADLRDAIQAKKDLERQRERAGAKVDSAVLTAYNEVNRRYRELLTQVKDAEANLKQAGWITSNEGGFKIELAVSKAGNKIFKVTDTYGKVPVTVGQAFSVDPKLRSTIPEAIRDSIINQFTYGEGNIAKERYADIPEGDLTVDTTSESSEETNNQPAEEETPPKAA
ncbi:MAG: hypothetical protein WC451_04630 [Patescibacteria group bacterium]